MESYHGPSLSSWKVPTALWNKTWPLRVQATSPGLPLYLDHSPPAVPKLTSLQVTLAFFHTLWWAQLLSASKPLLVFLLPEERPSPSALACSPSPPSHLKLLVHVTPGWLSWPPHHMGSYITHSSTLLLQALSAILKSSLLRRNVGPAPIT